MAENVSESQTSQAEVADDGTTDRELVTALGDEMGRQIASLAETLREENQMRFQQLEHRLDNMTGAVVTQPLPEDADNRGATLNDQAVTLFYRNELDQAAQVLEEATEMMPESVAVWNNLAMVYSGLGKPEKAAQAFQKAIGIDLSRTEILNNQAVLCLLQNNPQEALKILEEAKSANPQQISTLLNLAQAYLTLGHYGRAIYTWRLVTAIDPKQEEATRNLRQYYQ